MSLFVFRGIRGLGESLASAGGSVVEISGLFEGVGVYA